MAVDSSILLQGRPVQLDNPLEVQGRALQLRMLAQRQQAQDLEFQRAEEARGQERTLADLYRQNVGADGTVNRQGLYGGAAQAGLGNRIPGLQKQFADADESTAKLGQSKAATAKTELETQKERLNIVNGAFSSLLSQPNVNHQMVIQQLTGLVQQGIIPQEQGAQMARMLPGDPVQLRQFLLQKGLEVMDASKRLDLLTPKFQETNLGGSVQRGTVDQLTGQFTPGQTINKTVSPDAQLAAETTRRGQNMVDARTREATGAAMTKPFEVTGPDGTKILVQQDKQGNIKPVQGYGPKGENDKPLNDTQSKALLFGSRMRDASKELDALAEKGVNRPSVIKDAVSGVPLVGRALSAAANSTVVSADQQRAEQAQRDYITAVLRRESGAAIAQDEYETARKQYFPQVGDSPAVIAQKKRTRDLATEGLLAEVPAAKRNSIGTAKTQNTGVSGSWDAPADVPDDIAAILKKHGGK